MKRLLEVCAGSVASVVAAREGGAARVELCAALEIGGITPSVGLMEQARRVDGVAMHVLIRPRGGDFLYNEHEVACMERDIEQARAIGADGIVIGALTADGDIDIDVCRRLVAAAQGMNVTFHRAFDRCRNPLNALEDIIELGCSRLLTSGQAATAFAGCKLIARLVEAARNRIIIMPGCGVNAANAAQILDKTHAIEIHASARSSRDSQMRYRNSGVAMGAADNNEYTLLETDPHQVRQIVNAI